MRGAWLATVILVVPSAAGVRAEIVPYELLVREGSRNNQLDLSAAACHPVRGCFDVGGRPCREQPERTCALAGVPAGRCAAGTGGCVWPQGAGFCADAPDVACLSDGACPSGVCDLSTVDPACACDGALPFDDPALGEGVVCGGVFARCSDGDPLRPFGGKQLELCTEIGITGSSVRSGCGDAAGRVPARRGPRYEDENPSDRITPQREPGGGILLANRRPMRRIRTTAGLGIDAPGESDAFGVRRLDVHGASYWADPFFTDSTANGSVSATLWLELCDPPQGHQSQRVVDGSCAVGGAFCTAHAECASGSCSHGRFCREAARDAPGLIFTRDPDPGAIAAAGLTGVCPPDCYADYDFDTLEQEALAAITSLDARAGMQAALDHLGGRKAGARDALQLLPLTVAVWAPAGDVRCYLGGDPFRANPGDARIGRCTGSPTPCASNGDCPGSELCRRCGGTHGSEPEYGALASAIDPAASSLALPPGHDDLGFPELGLTSPAGDPRERRLGILNGVSSALRVVLLTAQTTGVAAAEFRDPTCPGAPDLCSLGEVAGGPPGSTSDQQRQIANVGLGTGGTYAQGQVLPLGGTCCASGASIAFRPQHATTPLGLPSRVADYGPGGDGIPGCAGDNDPAGNGREACDQVLGGEAPGNTGSDDRPVPYPNPNLAGNGGAADPSAPPAIPATSGGFRSGPGAAARAAWPGRELPTLSLRTALTARDLRLLLADSVDAMVKLGNTLCPLVGTAPSCGLPDGDGDGVPYAEDNCPHVSNPAQDDRGSVASTSPDGIGDACQCGDVTGEGIANGQDGVFIARWALGYRDPLFRVPGNCDVTGNGVCSGQDGFFTARAALGYADPPHLFGQRCPNADPR